MNENLPAAFLERMRNILHTEFEDFLACYEQPSISGLRVNTLKIKPEDFIKITPYSLNPVPWCVNGYQIQDEDSSGQNPGKHPYHAAGLYYLQDPSSMAPASIHSLPPGALVLDLAAAPGGKTTHLAAMMQNQGTIIANEIHPKRVWDLAENLERCGVTNAVVLNETPGKLAGHFGAVFDLVLLDAPCSGEGMFRKSTRAVTDWSLELVRGCAVRQEEILGYAARLIRPGGFLIYSTCTFSLEENENLLGKFLERMENKGDNFEIVDISKVVGFNAGITTELEFSSAINKQISRTVRLWPHHQGAEGHFLALLQRKGGIEEQKIIHRIASRLPSTIQLFKKFTDESLNTNLFAERIYIHGNYVYQYPLEMPELTGLKVIHPGWWLGTIKKNRFEPSHALALGLEAKHFTSLEKFHPDDENILRFLHGDTIRQEGPDGWTAIGVSANDLDVFVLGWGKRSQNIIKNYYPRGLRWF